MALSLGLLNAEGDNQNDQNNHSASEVSGDDISGDISGDVSALTPRFGGDPITTPITTPATTADDMAAKVYQQLLQTIGSGGGNPDFAEHMQVGMFGIKWLLQVPCLGSSGR